MNRRLATAFRDAISRIKSFLVIGIAFFAAGLVLGWTLVAGAGIGIVIATLLCLLQISWVESIGKGY